MAKRRPPKQRKAKAFQNRGWLEKLSALEARREPYAALLAGITQQVLGDFTAPGTAMLELGAGTGYLRSLLSSEATAGWLHTDPDAASLRRFAQRHPTARAMQAKAQALPPSLGPFDATIALCLLDVVADLDAVCREQLRVLQPGGCFIHLLDMTTALEQPFEDLLRAELLPIPNLFTDPSEQLWPHDLVVMPLAQAKALLSLCRSRGHGLAQIFGAYFDQFFAADFNAPKAAQSFHAIADQPRLRDHLQMLLADAQQLALGQGLGQLTAYPAASTKHVAKRIREAFERAGFAIERDAIATRWQLRSQPNARAPGYRSLCVGHERRYAQPPEHLLCADAHVPAAGQQLVETGVHVFVARRPASPQPTG